MADKQYVAAICTKCGHRQAVDAKALCKEQIPIVLGEETESRLKVTCKECKKLFTIKVNCSEYE